MPTEEQIRETILRVAGYPSVGVLLEMADELAAEIAALDSPPVRGKKASFETRVTGPSETR
jgi:hypothetical protein